MIAFLAHLISNPKFINSCHVTLGIGKLRLASQSLFDRQIGQDFCLTKSEADVKAKAERLFVYRNSRGPLKINISGSVPYSLPRLLGKSGLDKTTMNAGI